MSQGKMPVKVRYTYEKDSGLRPQYAHGVWGGINTYGEVEMNFYTESDKLPPYSERLVAPDGSFGHEAAPFEENLREVTRHVHASIVLNYHSARYLLEWLEEKVEVLEMDYEGGSRFEYPDEGDREQ